VRVYEENKKTKSLSAYEVAFWMLMGQSLLIRDWESVSSGFSLGRVGVYVVV
jgi:hypothetical protein